MPFIHSHERPPVASLSVTCARFGQLRALGVAAVVGAVSLAVPATAQSPDTSPTIAPVSPSLPPATPPDATTTTVAPSITPTTYVADALAFIERYGFRVPLIDWSSIRARAEQRASLALSISDTHPIIAEAVKALGDKHSSFIRPPEAATQTQGQYTGFGFLASMPSRIVITVAPGSPADRSGLKLGDRVDKVNGQPPRASGGVLSVGRQPNGEFAPSMTLQVARKGARKPITLTLIRGAVTLVSIPDTQPPPKVVVSPAFGYLDVPGIVGDAAAQKAFATQLHTLIRALDNGSRCGWIVDLRKNRGGYIYALLAGLAPLVGEGPAGGSRNARGDVTSWSYRGGSVFAGEEKTVSVDTPYTLRRPGSPVAVLTSGLTASAGEASTIFFRALPNARSFGAPTFGLTTFNVRKTLSDGAFLDITAAVDVDRAGNAYDGPIVPDEAVAIDWAQISTGNDAALLAASLWLRSQPGCAA